MRRPWHSLKPFPQHPPGHFPRRVKDMGRFMRALINGGELDGVRILSKARLEEMMTPSNPTSAGYVGLAFFGSKVLGHDSIGHDGGTMTFFSDLRIFPEQGIGIFVSRDGIGEITTPKDLAAIPNPVTAIARRFLPEAPEAAASAEPRDASVAGVYHSSRRADSSFLRINSFAIAAFPQNRRRRECKIAGGHLAIRRGPTHETL